MTTPSWRSSAGSRNARDTVEKTQRTALKTAAKEKWREGHHRKGRRGVKQRRRPSGQGWVSTTRQTNNDYGTVDNLQY